jgi:hypothetical protein
VRKRRELTTRPTRPPARTAGPVDYTVEILGRRYSAVDMVDASRKVEAIIAQTGMGASEIGAEFPIRANGVVVAYVSYNGRVWMGPPGSFDEKAIPVYEPSAHRSDTTPSRITPSRVVRNNPGGCYLHDTAEECREAPRGSCRYGGCDGVENYRDGTCKTDPRYFADTKSFFCAEHRAKFLRDYHWDDALGAWVDKDGQQG